MYVMCLAAFDASSGERVRENALDDDGFLMVFNANLSHRMEWCIPAVPISAAACRSSLQPEITECYNPRRVVTR